MTAHKVRETTDLKKFMKGHWEVTIDSGRPITTAH
jgi:hypothetical protein